MFVRNQPRPWSMIVRIGGSMILRNSPLGGSMFLRNDSYRPSKIEPYRCHPCEIAYAQLTRPMDLGEEYIFGRKCWFRNE